MSDYPWTKILDDLDPDLFDRCEEQTIRELGPLTRSDTEAKWRRYWNRVAELAAEHINN